MFVHTACDLPGPITRKRAWWGAGRPATAPFRSELVQRIRKEIADGTYDTSEKLQLALDRMIKRLED